MISGGGDHVKRTGSEEEWLVSVNDSCLETPTAQSPNLTWFSLDAAECKRKKEINDCSISELETQQAL